MQQFDQQIIDAATKTREIELTTYGRKSGQPGKVIIWIVSEGARLYVVSGQGLVRDWPQNLLANGRAILHIDGRDVAVCARQVTDPTEARTIPALYQRKYAAEMQPSPPGAPLTPAEQATFELLPAQED